MGGVGFGQIAQAVVGVGGVVGSTIAAKSQADYMNQLMSGGSGQKARVAGIDEYFLGGGKAQALNIPGMQDQFAEVDFAVQEQLRNVDAQANKSRQMIADNIPEGGAKLRALADLAMQTQEARGKVVREAQSTKRDLDTQLTNQYLQAAMGRNVGVSSDAKMYSTLQDYGSRQKDIAALGSTFGTLAGKLGQGEEQGSGFEYMEPTQSATPAAATWSGTGNEDYLTQTKPKIAPKFNLGKFTY